MGKRFERELGLRDKVMTLYMGLSFLVGLGILACLNEGLDILLIENPFAVLFCFMPAWLYCEHKSNLSYLSLYEGAEYFFLVHYALLISMTVELGHVGLHYMSVIPVMGLMGQVLNNWTLSKKERTDKAIKFLVLVYALFPAPFFFENSGESSILSRLLVSFFFSWQVISIFFTHFQIGVFAKKIRSLFKASASSDVQDSDHPLLRDRYFFHDLINHTHAMDLMLRYRIMKDIGMNNKQVRELSEQVGLLQGLVKEHFGFGHKNLDSNKSGDNFKSLFHLNESLLNAFLPNHKVRTFVSVNDPYGLRDQVNLPISAWQRILTNLLKNASEAECKTFEMIFSFSKKGLTVETKNDFFRLDHLDGELGKGLSRVIENMDESSDRGPGLGLEAIQLLSHENGGTFNFAIIDGLWKCSVEMNYCEVFGTDDFGNCSELRKKAS